MLERVLKVLLQCNQKLMRILSKGNAWKTFPTCFESSIHYYSMRHDVQKNSMKLQSRTFLKFNRPKLIQEICFQKIKFWRSKIGWWSGDGKTRPLLLRSPWWSELHSISNKNSTKRRASSCAWMKPSIPGVLYWPHGPVPPLKPDLKSHPVDPSTSHLFIN